MIIKIASLSQSSIDFIELTAGLSFSGFTGKKRLPKAKEYIDDLIVGQFTSYINVESIFGIDKAMLDKVVNYHYSQKLTSEVPLRVTDKTKKSESDIANLAKQISDAIVGYNNSYNEAAADLKSVSNKGELLEKIIEYLNIFISKGYTDFSESKSKAEELLVIEGVQNAPAIQEEIPAPQGVTKEEVVTFSEQPQVSPNDEQKDAFNNQHLKDYYVSESSDLKGYFAKGTKFFGPFERKIEAVLFSALIHEANFIDDYSVSLGSEVISLIQRRSKTMEKPSLSIALPPESSVIKNTAMSADFESRARIANRDISLSTSGDSFNLLKEYLINQKAFREIGEKGEYFSLGKLNSWYKDDGFFNLELFIKERSPKEGPTDAPRSLEEQDLTIPDGEGKKVKKTKSPDVKPNTFGNTGKDADKVEEYLRLDGLSGVINSVAILSEEDNKRLSVELLNKCFEDIKASSLSLDSITQQMVFDNPDACIMKLNTFFQSIIIKDNELYEQIVSFRSADENKLNIFGVTNLFEFRNHFSILQKIISEDVIISRISRIIGLAIYSRNFDKISKKIESELNAYLKATNRDGTAEEYIVKIQDSIPGKIIYAANYILKKDLSDIVNKKLSINPDELLKKDIDDISVNAIVKQQVRILSIPAEKIIEESKVRAIVCGVCDQEFSIPKERQDRLKKIDAEVKQRTFFKENGDLITENDLIANNKMYTLSSDANSLLLNTDKSAPAKVVRRRVGEESVTQQVKVQRSYTWQEANKMTISSNIDEQINGHIIRNDILASLGAVVAGTRGAFTNKVLCAGQLYNISENISQTAATKDFITKKNGFKCLGSKPPDADDYMSSANILPKKVDSSVDTSAVPRYSGFRFSLNNANCPCHLTKQSSQMIAWASVGEKSTKSKFIVAVPNIPGDVASQIAGIESGLDIESLYYPPTSPDGTLATGMQNSAYVVCANKTSISMFDRDPSSENFIQKFFKKVLDDGGAKRLSDTVAVLVNYGIEINDIRSHVEAVVVGSSNIEISGSRKKILQSIFKNSKISLAQDMSERGAQLIKNLGLVCQSGHKFTIEQSWKFAETHSGIFRGAETATPIKNEQIRAVLDGDGRDFQSLLSVGAITTTTDEEFLRRNGYRQPSELSDLAEIKNYIKEKRIYFKSGDDKMYYLSPHTTSGIVRSKPWDVGVLLEPTKFTRDFWQFAGALESTTQESEGGGKRVADIASPIYDSDDSDDSDEKSDINMNFAAAIIPDIDVSSAATIISRFTSQREGDIYSKAIIFVDNLITTLKMSRIWGIMAADAQIDFLARVSNSEPKNIPNIKILIESELAKIFSNIEAEYGITSGNTEPFISEFFSKYDILGLIERGVTSQQFFGLATAANYYEGFAVPPILNLNAEKGKAAVLASLSTALSKNITGMIRSHFGKQDLPAPNPLIIEEISKLLISPYDDLFSGNGYKTLKDSPITDYNGRAIIFSFAVDIADRINSFFSKHFFNENSALYIGPLGSADGSSIVKIRDLFGGQMIDGVFVQNILILDEDTFNSNVDIIRRSLYNTYKLDSLFQNYMQYKSVEISKDIRELQNQRAIVLERFAKIFDIANNSIEIAKIDLSGRRVDSPSVKRGAKLLDRTIDVFAARRESALFPGGKPSGATTLSDVIKKNREELNSGVFEANSVGYAKVNLSDFNEGFDKVAFESLSILKFNIKERSVNYEAINADLDENSKIPPSSILELKVISIGKIVTNSAEYRICIVTPIKIRTKYGSVETLEDTKKYLRFDGENIINPNQQGIDFISRYTRNAISDTSKFILVNSKNIEGSGQSVDIDDPSLEQMRISVNSSIRVGRVEKSIEADLSWPPRNTLFIDDVNVGKGPDDINNHYNELLSPKDHSLFMANIENFETSKTSRSVETTSSFGVFIPFKYGEDDPSKLMGRVSQMSNVSTYDSSEKKKHYITISDAKIYVRSQSGKSLDISWAFRTLDPQIYNEDGQLRHKLVQSTLVKKLNFISSEMMKCYESLKNKSGVSIQRLLAEESSGTEQIKSFDNFCDFLFSGCISWITVSPDMSRGVNFAKLNMSEINIDYIKTDNVMLGSNENIDEMINTLSKFIDYYNASQALNLEYSRLTPSISNSDVFNVSLKRKTKCPSLKLLDPYSIWKMITSKTMTTKFGGLINSEDVEQYKEFVISTFGIDDIARKVCEKVGFLNGEFEPEDMFDVVGFCKRYNSHQSIKLLKDLFSLQPAIVDEIATDDIRTYDNGMPIRGNKNKDLTAILSNAEYTEYSLTESSYIKHLYRTKTLLDNLTGAQLKDPKEVAKYKEFIGKLEDGSAMMTIKELLSLEKSLSIADNPSLYKEFSEIMLRLSKRPKTSSNKNISWRKIAQSATEDEGTIIRSLYHEWWDRYLNVMAKIAAQE